MNIQRSRTSKIEILSRLIAKDNDTISNIVYNAHKAHRSLSVDETQKIKDLKSRIAKELDERARFSAGREIVGDEYTDKIIGKTG